VQISTNTATDSAAMKTISVLGLVFLPGTFICVCPFPPLPTNPFSYLPPFPLLPLTPYPPSPLSALTIAVTVTAHHPSQTKLTPPRKKAIFSTTFFNFTPAIQSPDGHPHWTMSSEFWIYFAVAIPVTLLTIAFWFIWIRILSERSKTVTPTVRTNTFDSRVMKV
jgi:hypothetical protein